MIKAAALLSSLVVAVSACTSSGGTRVIVVTKTPPVATASQGAGGSPSASISGAGSADAHESIEGFVHALASNDPRKIKAAIRFAAPSSPAAAYLEIQSYMAEAYLDGGGSVSTKSVKPTSDGEGFRVCDSDSSCVTFGGFQVNPDGLVVDLTVNRKDVAPRITLGNGQAVRSAGARFTFLGAYKSIQSDALFVVLQIRTGASMLSPNTYSAVYRSPNGKQRQSSDAAGPTDIDANSKAVVYSVFQSVQPGGSVKLEGCVNDCNGTFSVTINVGSR